MILHLIKDGKEKVVEVENGDLTSKLKNPHCEFLNKYVNEENYSLVIEDTSNRHLYAFINKTITKEDSRKILDTARSLSREDKISGFSCCNYLEDDYDYIEVSANYKMDNTLYAFCEDKAYENAYYVKKTLSNYRNLNIRKCLFQEYDEKFPSNICRGGIIIGEDKRVDLGLNKRTHLELFEAYFNRKNCEIDDKSKAIFAIVSGPSVFIELPKCPINSFQKEELKKINEEVMKIRSMNLPAYLDVVDNGDVYNDLERFITPEKVKTR